MALSLAHGAARIHRQKRMAGISPQPMSISPDIQATFDYLFNLAAKALQADNRSFEPFATALTKAGERTHSTTDLGTMSSSPTEHLGALITVLADQARGGDL